MTKNEKYDYIELFMKNHRKGCNRLVLLPEIIRKFELKEGAEIGVSKGDHSLHLLKNTDIRLTLVDNYMDEYRADIALRHNGDGRYQDALNNLKGYIDIGRCKLIRGDSDVVNRGVEDSSLDFIYFDADHSYEGIRRDIGAWNSKIKDGGILSGHDYKRRTSGIIRYIDEFVLEHNYKLVVLCGIGCGWLVVK